MFTGLIEEIGQIEELTNLGPSQGKLRLHCHEMQEGMKLGDSLAVDGICLTVIRFDPQGVELEISAETMEQSLFASMKKGRNLNLERALRLGDRLGGHIVQGHVDARSRLLEVKEEGDFYSLSFSVPVEISPYLVHKGSIAINGISLTVASRSSDRFSVAVIPHTYKHTNLAQLAPGEEVHLESDVMARYIEALVQPYGQGKKSQVTMEFLREHGFG